MMIYFRLVAQFPDSEHRIEYESKDDAGESSPSP